MVETTINGVYHIEPRDIKNEQAKQVTTNPFNESVTKSMIPVKVSTGTKDIIICDTPGFEDT